MQDKIHIDEPSIPTDPLQRREWVRFVQNHPAFNPPGYSWFDYFDCVEVESTYVNPDTKCIDDHDSKNTLFQVWIEAGPMVAFNPKFRTRQDPALVHSHDLRLDCGADDLETALLYLAARVKTFYNDDGTAKNIKDECEYHSGNLNEFCHTCGFLITYIHEDREDEDPYMTETAWNIIDKES